MSYRLAGFGSQLAAVVLAAMMLDGGHLLLVLLALLLAWNMLLVVAHVISRHRGRTPFLSAVVQMVVPMILFAAAVAISAYR